MTDPPTLDAKQLVDRLVIWRAIALRQQWQACVRMSHNNTSVSQVERKTVLAAFLSTLVLIGSYRTFDGVTNIPERFCLCQIQKS